MDEKQTRKQHGADKMKLSSKPKRFAMAKKSSK